MSAVWLSGGGYVPGLGEIAAQPRATSEVVPPRPPKLRANFGNGAGLESRAVALAPPRPLPVTATRLSLQNRWSPHRGPAVDLAGPR